MRRGVPQWFTSSVRYLPLAGAALAILTFVVLASLRFRHPFELEWMEGGALEQMRAILAGQKLYVRPSLAFTPFVYPPLYFYVSALVAHVVGDGFAPLRLVSILASLASFGLIFAMVRRETRDAAAGLLAAGLYAATFKIGGSWFDISRIDPLFLVLVLGAFYLLRFMASRPAAVLAGVLLALAFFTKQTALVVSIPVLLYMAVTDWRRGIWAAGAFLVLVVGGTVWLDRIHDGWFSYYVFTVPSHLQTRIVVERVAYFWTRDVATPLGIAFGLSVFLLLIILWERRRSQLFYVAVAIGMFAGAWIPRVQSGGYQNTVIPAYAAVSLLFGLAFHEVSRMMHEAPGEHRAGLDVLLHVLCLVQFVALVYNPLAELPTAGDLAAGTQLVERLARVDGEVLVFSHGYLATMAGKKDVAHAVAMLDVLGWGDDRYSEGLAREIKASLTNRRFKAVVLDTPEDVLQDEIARNYDLVGPVFDNPKVFWPVTGRRIRPESFYVPKPEGR